MTATSQATSTLVATMAPLGHLQAVERRPPPQVDPRTVAVPWPGAELRRALGNIPPTSN